MVNTESEEKQSNFFLQLKFEKHKNRIRIFTKILLAIYFCGFVNYKITNGVIFLISKNGFFEETLRAFLHACLAFLVIFFLFPKKLPEELLRRKKNGFRFGMKVAVGFPLCLFLPSAALNLYYGANLSLFIPSTANVISLVLLSLSAAIEEEVVCRFLLFERLSQVFGIVISFAVQLFFFVILHMTEHGMSLTKFILLSITSLLFVVLYKRTQSLLVVMTMHFSYDFFLMLIFGGFLGDTHFVGFIGNALLGEMYSNYIKLVLVIMFIGYLIISNRRINNEEFGKTNVII
ncbi:lysostaphin resistance A-like protein [Undibacterium sp. TJN19]|uniref:CPBP family intramembrane glutamic endopeptidase n=1 Tax=Undibacterium sp. TJN19 TaxID=3413055 RepID=UPI003BF21238